MLGYLLMSILIGTLAWIAIQQIDHLRADQEAIHTRQLIPILKLREVEQEVHRVRNRSHEMIGAPTAQLAAPVKELTIKLNDKIKELSKEYLALLVSDEDKTEFNQMMTAYETFYSHLKNKIFPLVDAGKRVEAFELSATELTDDYSNVRNSLADFTDRKQDAAEKHYQHSLHTADFARTAIIIAGIFTSLVGIFFGWVIARSIGHSLKETEVILATIARGDLRCRLKSMGEDEIGRMGVSLNRAVESIGKAVEATQCVAVRIIEGSNRLQAASKKIADGVSEQASSVVQTSAAMNEMAVSIQSNAKDAEETEKLSTSVADYAKQCVESVRRAALAMKGISDKIGIIGEITRKTELLALNASVEAARAGEQGRGFGVVATEVGKLADSSQKSAVDIIRTSTEGKEITDTTTRMLNELLPRIERTRDLVQAISVSCEEQSKAAQEVNDSMLQLEKVVQQNNKAAEDMSETATNLQKLATELQKTMAAFQLGEEH
jgi:methyl-accepting chemotaxis protein